MVYAPSVFARIKSGGMVHLSRLSDSAGSVLCGYHATYPTEEIEAIAMPSQPTPSGEPCAGCAKVAGMGRP